MTVVFAALALCGWSAVMLWAGFRWGRQDGTSSLNAATAVAANANAASGIVLEAARAITTVDASIRSLSGEIDDMAGVVTAKLEATGERFGSFSDRVEALDSNVAMILNTMIAQGAMRRDDAARVRDDVTPARRPFIRDDAVPPPLDAGNRPLDGVMR